jgi:RNA polymerase sigma-70 factor (ECF subfamily)
MDINTVYENALAGDKKSREQLFQFLAESFRLFILQRIKNREDAEDVVQNALTIICDQFERAKITTSFAAWAYSVLKSQIMSYFKSRQLPKNLNVSIPDDYSDNYSKSDLTLKSQLVECLKKINTVNKSHVRILNLHFQGYSTQEICSKLRLSVSNVYTSLHRARAMLRKCLEKGDII